MELIETTLASIPGTTFALCAVAVLIAGFMRGFVGFGAAMILIMTLSLILGPRAAVAISSLSGVVLVIQLLPETIRTSEKPFVVPFGITTFVAAPFGTLVLVSLDPAIMKMAISVFVLFMVLMMWRGWRIGGGRVAIIGTGLAAGFAQGTAGVGGRLLWRWHSPDRARRYSNAPMCSARWRPSLSAVCHRFGIMECLPPKWLSSAPWCYRFTCPEPGLGKGFSPNKVSISTARRHSGFWRLPVGRL